MKRKGAHENFVDLSKPEYSAFRFRKVDKLANDQRKSVANHLKNLVIKKEKSLFNHMVNDHGVRLSYD